MPATHAYEEPDLLRVEVADLGLGPVQFTDERFDGELVVENLSDQRLTGTIELANESEQTFGADRRPLAASTVDISLDPGETSRIPIGGVGIVAGTGSAILVGINRPTVAEDEDDQLVIEPGSRFIPLASLVFWDRDFYRVNYRWPRRAQYISVAIAFLSAILAGMVIWLSVA